MRIAQVAPLYESVPPKLYGGTERTVSWLAEALVNDGHDVTLFASGDSLTAAELVPISERSLRMDAKCVDRLAHHELMLAKVARRARDFDVVHFHIDYFHFAMSRAMRLPQLTTLHGRLDLPDLAPLYAEYGDMPVVSISDAQRSPLPHARWLGTVYHGMPLSALRFQETPADEFAFIGRISPEKRVDRAIEIAVRLKTKIRIAAKIDQVDRAYFEGRIKPMLASPYVEFIGEIGDAQKSEFLGRAKALLFPIDWPEPFGLAMIEAMGCGTPVVAYRAGSTPEVVDHGVTGLLVEGFEEAVMAAAQISRLDRSACRKRFEERFSSARMAREYAKLYEGIIEANRRERRDGIKSVAFEAGHEERFGAGRQHGYPGELAHGRASGTGFKE